MTTSSDSSVTKCEHPEFTARVDVTRLSEVEGGPITGYTADIVVRCAGCNEPFDFIGLPVGASPVQPMVSFDGIEARMPLRPHFADAVPAPAPSSDPVNEGGRAMWVECAACNKGAQFIAGGELRRFEYEHTRQTGHGTFNVGPLTTPVLSPTEAGAVMVAYERLERACRAVQERSWPVPPSVEAALRMLDDAKTEEARRGR